MGEDERIMQQVQAGRTERFAELVSRHQSALFRYARSRLGGRCLAEDAVQEALLAAFRGRSTFDPSRSFRTWLWTILANTCGRVGKKSARMAPWDGSAPGFAEAADREAERRDETERLARFLEQLPEDQADAVRMRFFSELSYEEVGGVQGCSPATAKSRVRYGLAKLSDLMKGESVRQS